MYPGPDLTQAKWFRITGITLVEYLALELEKVLPHGAVEKERLQLQPPGGQRGQRLLAKITRNQLDPQSEFRWVLWILISVSDPDDSNGARGSGSKKVTTAKKEKENYFSCLEAVLRIRIRDLVPF